MSLATAADQIEFTETTDTDKMTFVKSTTNSVPISVIMNAACLVDHVIETDFGHSLYCKLVPEDLVAMGIVQTKAQTVVPKDFGFKSFVNSDGTFFLKLKTKNDAYKAKILPPMNPKNPKKTTLKAGSNLAITGSINVWINTEAKTSGVYFDATEIRIDGAEDKKKKK